MRRFWKWVAIPAAAAAIGYFALGPRLAGKVPIPKVVREGVDALASPKEEATTHDTPVVPPPRVSVGVKPVEETHRSRRGQRPAEP